MNDECWPKSAPKAGHPGLTSFGLKVSRRGTPRFAPFLPQSVAPGSLPTFCLPRVHLSITTLHNKEMSMATESKKLAVETVNRLMAGTIATVVTVLIFVSIQMLATYYAASPLVVSAAQLAA